jgi:Flp pilus assembly protein TadB
MSKPGPRANDDEETIESYMAALLTRMRGDGAPPVIAAPQQPARNKRKCDSRSAGAEVHAAPTPSEAVPVVDMQSSSGEMQRRPRTAMATDLTAMRELANVQARQAIDTHGQKRSLHRAFGTLGSSLACFLAAFLVLAFTSDVLMKASAMVILVVGIYWFVSAMLAAKSVFATMRRKSTGLRAILEEVEAELAANEAEAAAEAAAEKRDGDGQQG